jgi:hypothetical protein
METGAKLNRQSFRRNNHRLGSAGWVWLKIDTIPTGSGRIITHVAGDPDSTGLRIDRYQRMLKIGSPTKTLVCAWTDVDAYIYSRRSTSVASIIGRTDSRVSVNEYTIDAVSSTTGEPTATSTPARQLTTDRVINFYNNIAPPGGVVFGDWWYWESTSGPGVRVQGDMLILRM